MTAAELEYMVVTMNETTPPPNTAMAKRLIAKGWAQYTPGLWVQFTRDGLTALNNMRAAMGSAEWKP
jgi:Mn-dependent DtxR family transcriptional regulator